jgi:4-amino-4-deoxy-L-arabinose transferase-like glycosyltransferase
VVLLAALLLARLLTLGALPLLDTTEGRYAEIGREMAASGNWITPTLHGGEPFWGKPPLHFWLTAASIRALGATERAARLPSFLAAVATLVVVWKVGRRAHGPEAARIAVLLLGSSGLFFLLAGAVVLDVTFTLATTGALGSFLLHRKDPERRAPGLLFFLFLGLGLLAKGPVAAVLVFLPVVAASLLSRGAAPARPLPWAWGAGIVVLLAAPWHLLAERATPGFLDYFFIHEHILRYLRKEYGDLYGHGHVSPYGLVWALGLVSFLPWTIALFGAAGRALRSLRSGHRDTETLFLWVSALTPLVFFTFSRSLSLPYVLPSLPFFALLLGKEMAEEGGRVPGRSLLVTSVLLLGGAAYARVALYGSSSGGTVLLGAGCLVLILSLVAARARAPKVRLALGALVFPVFILAGTASFPEPVAAEKSARSLARVAARASGEASREVLFYGKVPLSAEFYFQGRVRSLGERPEALAGEVAKGGGLLVIRADRAAALPEGIRASLRDAGWSGRYRLFHMVGTPSTPGGEDASWR